MIEIIIRNETASEALLELRELAGGITAITAFTGAQSTGKVLDVETEPAKPKRTRKAKEESAPEPVETEQPLPDAPPEEEDDNEPDTDGAIPTAVEIRQVSTAYHNNEPAKKNNVKALMTEFGAAKLTDLGDDQRLPFMQALKGLA
jgi:hypothetical protein